MTATARASFYVYNLPSDVERLGEAVRKAQASLPPMSFDDLYRQNILDHYQTPRNLGTLEHPDISAEDANPLCGDQIRIDLRVKDGKIGDVRFTGKGCSISQAAASMLSEEVGGKSLEEVKQMTRGRRARDARHRAGAGAAQVRAACAQDAESGSLWDPGLARRGRGGRLSEATARFVRWGG